MADQQQQGGGQGKAPVDYWGDFDQLIKNLELREQIEDAELGQAGVVIHNGLGPWTARLGPDNQWHESDKIGPYYDSQSDDLVTVFAGNPIAQGIVGLLLGIKRESVKGQMAIARAYQRALTEGVGPVMMAELEGSKKKKGPPKLRYYMERDEAGRLNYVMQYEGVDADKMNNIPPFPMPPMGAYGVAGGISGAYGGHCEEECDFVKDLSKKVQELEAYAGVPSAEA
jgi:hypothetical protein